MVTVQIRQRENFAIKQEINPANSQPINYETPFQEPLRQLINLQTEQAELSSLLVEQQKQNILPAKELHVFSGNAFDYSAFMTAFYSIFSENLSSNKDRLYFLEKYTVGRANEIVRGFLAVNSEGAYTEARKPLDKRFGDPVHVAEADKSRLFNWPRIKDGDSAGLQALSDFLFRCYEALRIVGSSGELDSTPTLTRVSAKLPSYSGVKWRRHAYDTRKKSGSNVSFAEFVQFVKEESDLANDPVFSPDVLKRERKGLELQRIMEAKDETRQTALPLALSRNNARYARGQSGVQKERVEERRAFVQTKGLCFGCLKSGHLSSSCRFQLTCEECGKPHPTLLHNSVQTAKRPPRNSKQRNSDSQAKNLPIAATYASITSGNESTSTDESVCVAQQVYLTL